ncbi:Zinc finger cchc domain-containing protein, partial [Thalictrum thalictroides]
GTKFASCFICNERGHLSKNCPKNTHGIYPKGGSCKVCGGVTHLARDCPNKVQKSLHAAYGVRNSQLGGEYAQKPTRIKFTSGDDLDDDFMAEDVGNDSIVDDDETKVQVNPKKKQGHKVVNFLG